MLEIAKPKPLNDEIIDSFILRAERLTGCPTKAISYLNRTGQLRVHPLMDVAGKNLVWGAPAVVELSSTERLRLSMLRLFQPTAQDTDSIRPWFYSARADAAELRAQFAHCALCTAEDVSRRGYSYWRREHQVQSNLYCLEHGFTIFDSCQKCQTTWPIDELPETECGVCGTSLIDALPDHAMTPLQETIFRRIAIAARGLLSGSLKGSLALEVIGEAVQRTVPCRTPGQFNNAARYLCDVIGRDLLTQMNVDPRRSPTYGWPAIYLSGKWYRRSPNLELLLFGAFGSSAQIGDFWTAEKSARRIGFENTASLDTRFLRQAYRNETTKERARSLNVSVGNYGHMIAPYPGLSKRIKAFRRRRKARAQDTLDAPDDN